MRLAYADPPYIGKAKRHYANDPSGIEAAEVDHEALIDRLRGYDGWALSCMSTSLGTLLPMAPEARVGAWVKTFCAWKPTYRVQYAWEPVLFVPARNGRSGPRSPSVVDWVAAPMTTLRGTHGAKPDTFLEWVLALLGAASDDEVDDLYPGTGRLGEVLEQRHLWGPRC